MDISEFNQHVCEKKKQFESEWAQKSRWSKICAICCSLPSYIYYECIVHYFVKWGWSESENYKIHKFIKSFY